MFCTGCGKNLEDGSKFCTGCGKVLSGASSEPIASQPAAGAQVSTPAMGGNTVQGTVLCAKCGDQEKLSPEKVILALADKIHALTLRKIITDTSLEMDEAEIAINKLVDKGIARKVDDPSGKSTYIFD